jgi:ABC-type nitrate/sulfonate/bicarbonate transport system substrate-binding protein
LPNIEQVTPDTADQSTVSDHRSCKNQQLSFDSGLTRMVKGNVAALTCCMLALLTACQVDEKLALNVELGGRTVSKLPFVIAADQGLYEKYGLDVTIKLPPPSYPGGIAANPGGDWASDIFVDGLTPNIVKQIERAGFPRYVAIASNDCIVRAHIVSRRGITELADLKEQRIGISGRRDTTTGYAVLELARRMGWDPTHDIAIKFNGRDVEDLEQGEVDAIIASETRYAVARQSGYPVLEDTQLWGEAVGGNSVLVTREWLSLGNNREKARKFLMATTEGLALFHADRELALDVMRRWYGIDDRAVSEVIYERGQWMPTIPYPCEEGIDNTLEMYDSLEMSKHETADFYDDSLINELKEAGFFESLPGRD